MEQELGGLSLERQLSEAIAQLHNASMNLKFYNDMMNERMMAVKRFNIESADGIDQYTRANNLAEQVLYVKGRIDTFTAQISEIKDKLKMCEDGLDTVTKNVNKAMKTINNKKLAFGLQGQLKHTLRTQPFPSNMDRHTRRMVSRVLDDPYRSVPAKPPHPRRRSRSQSRSGSR